MPLHELMTDKIIFVKKHGTVVKSNIPAAVTSKEIITYDMTLQIEVGDSFYGSCRIS